MRVSDVMTRDVQSCRPDETLSRAAQLMWEHDCGSIPVVDAERKVVGMITDRDICMAAYTQGVRLDQVNVGQIASRTVISLYEDDGIEVAESLMRKHRVRRLPVLASGGVLVGILSIHDLVRRAISAGRDGPKAQSIAVTLASLSTPKERPKEPAA